MKFVFESVLINFDIFSRVQATLLDTPAYSDARTHLKTFRSHGPMDRGTDTAPYGGTRTRAVGQGQ